MCRETTALALETRVVVFAHRREVHKTTNTARLVPLALSNAEVRVVGRDEDRRAYEQHAAPHSSALVLYPTPDSRPLTRELALAGPVTLLVPDGNWRQAFKIATKEQALARLPHVHLPDGPPSSYALRTHPEPRYLATFEAIARALGILEGPAVQRALEEVLARKVERTLWTRKRPPSSAVHAPGA